MLKRTSLNLLTAESWDENSEEYNNNGFVQQIQTIIDMNRPIMLGINFKGGGAHAVLAIGYEKILKVLYIYIVLILDMKVIQLHIGIWLYL